MFKAPNHTQTPNEFFDDIAKTLKEGELRILLVIMRQTFGWHKAWDRISLSQLERKTGMCRDAVNNSLKSLIEKKLIVKQKEGINGITKCWYSLMIDEWPNHDDDERENDGIEKEDSNNSYQSSKTTPTSRFRRPTKETITKEINPPISPQGGLSPRKKIHEEKIQRAPEVSLTDTQHKAMLAKCNGDEKLLEAVYTNLSDWKIGKGISGGKNDFKACCGWPLDEAKKQSKDNPLEKVTTLVEKIKKKYSNHKSITFGHNYIEFIRGTIVVHIKYTDLGFCDQVFSELRKININPNEL